MKSSHWDTIVIGGGAAGMMAAFQSAVRGRRTLLLEKNRKLGVKILISGGTRCNLTHRATAHEIAAAFPRSQRRFLGSALAALPPQNLLHFFHQAGVATKVEATGKVFPVSNRAIDVRDALVRRMSAVGVQVRCSSPVLALERMEDGWLTHTPQESFASRAVMVACGGQSYPGCGTTGDGYAWARELGHQVVTPVPALVPLKATDEWLKNLQGLTIPDAMLTVTGPLPGDVPDSSPARRRKLLDQRRGSLLITHLGLSGPVTLDISRAMTQSLSPEALSLTIDFWPAVSDETCRGMILKTARQEGKKQTSSLQLGPLPSRLIESVLLRANIDPTRKMAELSKTAVQQIIHCVKHAPTTTDGNLGFAKAEVTAGGVSLDEVNPKTMESKLAAGCYFIGEVLDIDGPIGGYNFQAAFSTGWLAGVRS